MTVSVLGTEYTIKLDVDPAADNGLTNRYGYCARISKQIVLADLKKVDGWKNETRKTIAAQNKISLRHEIIHAFLNESRLQESSSGISEWAENEEMVDWIALQFPKILKAFKEAKAI